MKKVAASVMPADIVSADILTSSPNAVPFRIWGGQGRAPARMQYGAGSYQVHYKYVSVECQIFATAPPRVARFHPKSEDFDSETNNFLVRPHLMNDLRIFP